MKRGLVARWSSLPEPAVSVVSIQTSSEGVRATDRKSLRRTKSIAEVLNGPRRSKSRARDSLPSNPSAFASDLADDSDFENEPEQELVDAWSGARRCADPFVGSVVGVRVEVRSR